MNRVGKGGAVKSHRHEVSVLSGAFYPIADKGSTPLVFKSPLHPYKMSEPTDGAGSTQFAVENYNVTAETGKLILFPSWLEHFTMPTTFEGTRMTISINVMPVGLTSSPASTSFGLIENVY